MGLGKRKRMVRIHVDNSPSLEGILLGKSRGHYVLTAVKAVKDEETTYTIEGEARVPKGRVSFYQVVD